MSTRKGGEKKGPPKHQNRTAWKPQKDVKKKSKELGGDQNKVPSVSGVCQRCYDQIQWKIKYGKYKPLREPGKCSSCSRRNVKQPYNTLCNDCAKQKNVCPKCCVTKEHIIQGNEEQDEDAKKLAQALGTLRERDRRTLLREIAKGESAGKLLAEREGGGGADDDSGDSDSDDDAEGSGSDEGDGEEGDEGSASEDGDELDQLEEGKGEEEEGVPAEAGTSQPHEIAEGGAAAAGAGRTVMASTEVNLGKLTVSSA